MKRILSMLFTILSVSVYSQSFNVSISGGYCLPLATDFHSVSAISFQNQGNYPPFYIGYEKVSPHSSAQGGNAAIELNWFSKKGIGFGLKINALISTNMSFTESANYFNGTVVNYNVTDKPLSLQFMPHISFRHDFKLVSPVIEMGMLAGMVSVKESYNASSNYGDVEFSKINIHGNVLLGFYSSLGVLFRVSKVVNISLAVNCSAASYSPAKWTRKAFTFNNVDQMNSLSTSDKQGIFVKELDLTATQYPGEPHRELKYSIPFSNIGINAGVCFVLAKKKKEQIKENPLF